MYIDEYVLVVVIFTCLICLVVHNLMCRGRKKEYKNKSTQTSTNEPMIDVRVQRQKPVARVAPFRINRRGVGRGVLRYYVQQLSPVENSFGRGSILRYIQERSDAKPSNNQDQGSLGGG